MSLHEHILPFLLVVVMGNISLQIMFNPTTSLEWKMFALTFLVVTALAFSSYVVQMNELYLSGGS